MRIITECKWYGPSRTIVVHRTVHANESPYRLITGIMFSDGSTLTVEHRPAKPRERVRVINGYNALLDNFAMKGMTGFCRVSDLHPVKELKP